MVAVGCVAVAFDAARVRDDAMRRTVWKFPLADGVDVNLQDPRVVHVGIDPAGVACAWVEHDCDINLDEGWLRLRLSVYGTGHLVGDGVHCGSFIDGEFVGHVYDETVRP